MQRKHNKLDKINKNQLFVGNDGDVGAAYATAVSALESKEMLCDKLFRHF